MPFGPSPHQLMDRERPDDDFELLVTGFFFDARQIRELVEWRR